MRNDTLKRQEHFTELADHQEEHETSQKLYHTDKNTEVVDIVLRDWRQGVVELASRCERNEDIEGEARSCIDQVQNLPLINRDIRLLLD